MRGRDFNKKVDDFCTQNQSYELGRTKDKAEELCRELRSCRNNIGESDAQRWSRKLDDVSHSLSACEQAKGMESACNPFFDKAERLIRECHQL